MTDLLTCTTRLLAPAQIGEVLRACWMGDAALLTTFHRKAPCTLTEAVVDTVAALRTADGGEVFALETPTGELVGVVGFEMGRTALTTFGLAKGWRNPDGRAHFWDALDHLTKGAPLLVAVYARNPRAARFLTEAGGAVWQGDFTDEATGLPGSLYTL